MKGQNHLLRLRMGSYTDGRGRTLGDQSIDRVDVTLCDTVPAYGHFTDPENGYTGRCPELDILPADIIGALDLRCLHGLRVMAHGTSKARMGDFCRRATQFEPAELLICLPDCLVTWRAGRYEKFPVSECQTDAQARKAGQSSAPECVQELNVGATGDKKGLAHTDPYPRINSTPQSPNFQHHETMESA